MTAEMDNLKRRAIDAGLLNANEAVDIMTTGPAAGSTGGADIFGYVRELKASVTSEDTRKRMLRVESDGTPEGTKVYVGDIQVSLVQNVKLVIDGAGGVPEVTLTALSTQISLVTEPAVEAASVDAPDEGGDTGG